MVDTLIKLHQYLQTLVLGPGLWKDGGMVMKFYHMCIQVTVTTFIVQNCAITKQLLLGQPRSDRASPDPHPGSHCPVPRRAALSLRECSVSGSTLGSLSDWLLSPGTMDALEIHPNYCICQWFVPFMLNNILVSASLPFFPCETFASPKGGIAIEYLFSA